ncbi:hypothetical protein GJ496_007978 [Pomphorhynchus laevis]|nr:hypothetical protein GJ496_007978 [Pomphorhynchus laevis]
MVDSYRSTCPHVVTIGCLDKTKVLKEVERTCSICQANNNDLWICLREGCLEPFCGISTRGHNRTHNLRSAHSLSFNVASERIWCFACNSEVFENSNRPSFSLDGRSAEVQPDNNEFSFTSIFEPSIYTIHSARKIDRGTCGLLNIGNLCFMNSVLQALSNCISLTSYFIDFGCTLSKKCALSTVYAQFIADMWLRRRSTLLNSFPILSIIGNYHSVFHDDCQQDAQEFLRYFLGKMHTELILPNVKSHWKDRICIYKSANFDDDVSTSNTIDASCIASSSSGIVSWATPDGEADEIIDRTSDSPLNPTLSTTAPMSGDNDPDETKPPQADISVISQLFDGTMQSQVQCLTCERRSVVKEVFQELSLSLPSQEQLQIIRSNKQTQIVNIFQRLSFLNMFFFWLGPLVDLIKSYISGHPVTLMDSLELFFSADELRGDNMYSCDQCKMLRNGIRSCEITSLPEVLSFHLKRSRRDFLSFRKLNNYVSFPLIKLDMSPYVSKDCMDEVKTYNLFAIIVHEGNVKGGHFKTYALNFLNNCWYEYNDAYVRMVEASYVLSLQAYVLFYSKSRNESSAAFKEKLMASFPNRTKGLFRYYVSKKWLNNFDLLSHPGPISNFDFVCPHGDVRPELWPYIHNVAVPVPEEIWEALHEKYGGGPVSNQLLPCVCCIINCENIQRRQRYEKENFIQFSRNQSDDDARYAISMTWFKLWERFVQEIEDEIPGPIDNRVIAANKYKRLSNSRSRHTNYEYIL